MPCTFHSKHVSFESKSIATCPMLSIPDMDENLNGQKDRHSNPWHWHVLRRIRTGASTVGTNSLNTTIWQHGIHRIWISLLMFPCISIMRTTTLSFPRPPPVDSRRLTWKKPRITKQEFFPELATVDTAVSQTVKQRRKVPIASWGSAASVIDSKGEI